MSDPPEFQGNYEVPLAMDGGVALRDVERVTLRPGDVLIAHIDTDMDVESATALADHLRDHFPENKVIVMAGVSLEVVSNPDQKTTLPPDAGPFSDDAGIDTVRGDSRLEGA